MDRMWVHSAAPTERQHSLCSSAPELVCDVSQSRGLELARSKCSSNRLPALVPFTQFDVASYLQDSPVAGAPVRVPGRPRYMSRCAIASAVKRRFKRTRTPASGSIHSCDLLTDIFELHGSDKGRGVLEPGAQLQRFVRAGTSLAIAPERSRRTGRIVSTSREPLGQVGDQVFRITISARWNAFEQRSTLGDLDSVYPLCHARTC
jgi:hypothetical protein